MRFRQLACLVLLVGGLGACSNTFVYNQLDWLIPWYVDDYVDLDRDQKRLFKTRLRTLLKWHRGEELASYIEILDRIEVDLQGPVTGEQVEDWANLTYAAYERVEVRMLPLLFEIGNELSDDQMQEFIDKLADEQAELEEEYLERSDDEYFEDSRDSFVDNLDDFLGRLTPEQIDVLETAAAGLQRFDAAWLEERGQWLTTLSRLLQREPGWEDAVVQALADRERNRTEAYRRVYAHNGVIVNNAIADVLTMRTEQQAARLQRELDDLRHDLRKLIEQGES